MAGDHYIQQKYLRGFSVDGSNDRVAFWHLANGENVLETGTAVLCAEKDFFTTYDESGNKNKQIDAYLTSTLEPSLGVMLNILERNKQPTVKQMKEFSKYIAFKYYMVPHWRELHTSLSKKYLKHLKDRAKPGIWAEELYETFTKDAQYFTNMYWRVWKAPKGAAFITSDNPVACASSPDGNPKVMKLDSGLAAKNIRIFFPLNKKLMLVMWSSKTTGFEYMHANKTWVSDYNNITQQNCNNYLIGPNVRLVQKFALRAKDDKSMHDAQKIILSSL